MFWRNRPIIQSVPQKSGWSQGCNLTLGRKKGSKLFVCSRKERLVGTLMGAMEKGNDWIAEAESVGTILTAVTGKERVVPQGTQIGGKMPSCRKTHDKNPIGIDAKMPKLFSDAAHGVRELAQRQRVGGIRTNPIRKDKDAEAGAVKSHRNGASFQNTVFLIAAAGANDGCREQGRLGAGCRRGEVCSDLRAQDGKYFLFQ